ncbi:MAG: biotin/lipoyl-containing protein [Actinomycetes bacterium]
MAGQESERTDRQGAQPANAANDLDEIADASSLDRVVSTTTAGSWLALVAIVAALVAAVIWSFVAVVPQQITDVGIVDARSDARQVVSPVEGVVQFTTTDGTAVNQGSPIARVTTYEGKLVPVTAPIAGTVSGIAALDGSSVSRGTALMIVSVGPQEGIGSAATLVSADRAALYSGNPSLLVSFTDLATGITYSVPARVTSISNTPTTLGEQPSAAVRRLFETSSASASDQVLYQVSLQLLNLQTVPTGSRTVGGQVLSITNTYARPHPFELLFSDSP